MLGQEATPEKSGETTAIPVLLERLAAGDGLKGALVSIDAIATNAAIAQAIRDKGADYLLAVKANQQTIRREIEGYFADAPLDRLASDYEADKGHGHIEERTVNISVETDWLNGARILKANSTCRTRPVCSASRPALTSRTIAAQIPATTSPRAASPPKMQHVRVRPLGDREQRALDPRHGLP